MVPIVKQDGALVVDGRGQPIEYAVRMKQFAHEDELLTLLDEHRVEVGEITDLAERLAQFHAHVPIVRSGGAEQEAQRVRGAVMGNLAQLVSSTLPVEVSGPLGRLIDWTHDAANALEDALCNRSRDIRECHGDLHAGNIVRHGGHLLPFDCIEFNPDLRCINVINDVAFLFMDLISHGRSDLAHALLSRYLEVSGDYAGTRLLRFYAVYRALVRARIDALSAEEVPSRSQEFQTRLKHRIEAATTLAQPAVPTLVLMHGVSGSGKSWLSERLVAALPAVRVRSDLERKRLASGMGEAKGLDIHSAEFNHRTYARLLECAESCLAAGITVIVDATFLEASDRELFRALAMRMRAACVIVSCHVERSVLLDRVAARSRAGSDASDADLAVLRGQLASLTPFEAEEEGAVLLADTESKARQTGLRVLYGRATTE